MVLIHLSASAMIPWRYGCLFLNPKNSRIPPSTSSMSWKFLSCRNRVMDLNKWLFEGARSGLFLDVVEVPFQPFPDFSRSLNRVGLATTIHYFDLSLLHILNQITWTRSNCSGLNWLLITCVFGTRSSCSQYNWILIACVFGIRSSCSQHNWILICRDSVSEV